jgi:hypothetical protein
MRNVWTNDDVRYANEVEVWTDANHTNLQVRKRVGRDSRVVAVASLANYVEVLQHNIRNITKDYPSQIKQQQDATEEGK